MTLASDTYNTCYNGYLQHMLQGIHIAYVTIGKGSVIERVKQLLVSLFISLWRHIHAFTDWYKDKIAQPIITYIYAHYITCKNLQLFCYNQSKFVTLL